MPATACIRRSGRRSRRWCRCSRGCSHDGQGEEGPPDGRCCQETASRQYRIHRQGQPRRRSGRTGPAFRDFVMKDWLPAQRFSTGWRKRVGRMLDQHLLPAFGALRLDHIGRPTVEHWFDAVSCKTPSAAKSQRAHDLPPRAPLPYPPGGPAMGTATPARSRVHDPAMRTGEMRAQGRLIANWQSGIGTAQSSLGKGDHASIDPDNNSHCRHTHSACDGGDNSHRRRPFPAMEQLQRLTIKHHCDP